MAAVLERFRRKVPNTRTRSPANEAAALAAAGAVPSSTLVNGNFQTPSVTPSQSPLHHPSASPARQPSVDAAADTTGNASSSFMQKPQRGWLHPDRELRPGSGVSYGVRYIGALEVTKPMRTLDFEVRTRVAKESINRVCEAAGLKSINKKRKVERKIQSLLGERPDLHNAGFNVRLTITTDALDVVCEDGDRPGETICHHPMQGVSFASGGDAETLDFVAYVAKDATYARACHVLECGGGLAQDVLTTVGQAFELRFKEFLQNSPRATETPPSGNLNNFQQPTVANDVASTWSSADGAGVNAHNDASPSPAGRQYYNDIPSGGSPSVRRNNGGDIRGFGNEVGGRGGILLQDNQPPPPIPPLNPVGGAHVLPSPSSTDSLGSTNIGFATSSTNSSSNTHPNNFFPTLPPPPTSSPPPPHQDGFDPPSAQPPLPPVPGEETADPLQQEAWFHGKITRPQAESLLRSNGDFLVRESSHQEGQFVLTGLHAGVFKHLLLIDPQGVVRTKDKKFDNVSHLIHFHRDNHVPIVSEDSELLLLNPILRI